VQRRFFDQGFVDTDGAILFYTKDHLGSIREVTDRDQVVRARYSYDPYGRMNKDSGDKDAPFTYTGHYWHAPSGLNLTMYRAYDPSLGRWLSRDPIAEEGGINLYIYVDNDPINGVDPLGLDTWLYWVSRPIDIPKLSAFEHSAMAVAVNGNKFFISAGPKNPDGTGQNLARLSGKPDAPYNNIIDINFSKTNHDRDEFKKLIDEWNDMNIPYKPSDSNCHDFINWVRNRLRLKNHGNTETWRRPHGPVRP